MHKDAYCSTAFNRADYKQSKCPLVGNRLNKWWYVYKEPLYSHEINEYGIMIGENTILLDFKKL